MAGVVPANAPLPPVPVVVSAALSDDMPVLLDSTDVVVHYKAWPHPLRAPLRVGVSGALWLLRVS